MNRKDIVWLTSITILAALITALPYLYGYVSAPPDKEFMGIALGTPDTTQYFTWMRSFSQSWLIGNRMTPEPTEMVFFNLLWWLMGQMAFQTGWSLAAVYQIFRLVTVFVFVPLVYWLVGLFLEKAMHRWMAFLLILVGAGFGWVLIVIKYLIGNLFWPFDVYIVEHNSFLSLMAFPHFSNAATFIITILALDLLAVEQQRMDYAVGAGVIGLVLGFVHAYDLLLIYAVIGLFALVVILRERRWRKTFFYTVIIGVLSCPGAFYSFYITKSFPTWSAVLDQFVNAGAWTPAVPHLPILLGLPFICALIALATIQPVIPKNNRALLIKVWFIAHCVLIYFPVNYQIHYLNGWQFPIAVLAVQGLFDKVVPWLQDKFATVRYARRLDLIMATLFFLIVVPTNLYLFVWRFYDLSRHTYPYFLYRDEVAALRWLDRNSAPASVVLSSMDLGQYIPALTGNRAFLAHWAMTLDLYRKQDVVKAFYDTTWSDAERRSALKTYQVQYVFWGQAEQALGKFDLDSLPYLTRVFDSPQAKLYRVAPEVLGNQVK